MLKYHPCIYLFTYLSISLFIHLFTCLFITYLFIHLFIIVFFFHALTRCVSRVPRSPRSCPSSPKKTQKNIQLFFTYKKYLLHIYRALFYTTFFLNGLQNQRNFAKYEQWSYLTVNEAQFLTMELVQGRLPYFFPLEKKISAVSSKTVCVKKGLT